MFTAVILIIKNMFEAAEDADLSNWVKPTWRLKMQLFSFPQFPLCWAVKRLKLKEQKLFVINQQVPSLKK